MNPKLEQIYKQIPKSACPSSCGKCCGILYPSLAELRNIRDWCEQKGIEYKDFNYQLNADCPYLTKEKTCGIYPVRPFLCRIYGVSKELPCKGCKPEKMLNRNQSACLYNQIYLHGKEKSRTEKHRQLVKALIADSGI
jgi:hypothetical protein